MPELHSIRLLWPFMLWGLSVLPLLLLAYVWWIRREVKVLGMGLRWVGSNPARAVATGAGFWRRHGLMIWMLLGLAVVLVALTRPKAILLLPGRMETIMLAIDSSGSMRADDVQPSRIQAAQAVARQFIQHQPAFVKVGIVSVAGTASVVQAPTDDREALLSAVDNLPLQIGSALGSGVVISLSQLLPASGLNVPKLLAPDLHRPDPSLPKEHPANRPATPAVKLEPGSHESGVMVLLTDGEGNVGPDLADMAQVAADMGVRIFTIGFGTSRGAVLKAEGVQARVKLDETVLKKVAERTRGEYFQAVSSQDVAKIYEALSLRIEMKKHQLAEVTALVAGFGMLWMLAGAGWSLLRRGRVF